MKSKTVLILAGKAVYPILYLIVALLFQSCATKRKIQELSLNNVRVGVSIADNVVMENLSDTLLDAASEEKIAVVDRLGKVYVMEAVKDDELGEMVISEKLEAVVVEAKFRNVAERNGYVDIAFDVKVPHTLQASDWQVRITPVLDYVGKKVKLDKIYITGSKYRASQLKGYELYKKFLNSIIPHDADFISTYTHKRLLELFIERNFKDIAKLKQDTSVVEESIESELFGVTRNQVIEHYTRERLIRRNERRIANKGKMYAKYIKAPLECVGVRLDSVINNPDSSVVYHYTHTIPAQRGLKRVDLVLGGEIWQLDRCIYTMPATDPLTYYISSLTFFADNSTRYIKKVIERNAVANTVSYIDFKAGDYKICDTLRNNYAEIVQLKENIRNILGRKDYIVDSLVITASCSPEGSYSTNEKLAEKRAESIKDFFKEYVSLCRDSLNNEYWEITLNDVNINGLSNNGQDGDIEENISHNLDFEDKIGTRWIAENWDELSSLIKKDINITDKDYIDSCMSISDLDNREKAILKLPSGKYIKETLYPYLRSVKFDFYMHRKGMIKDTVHSKEVDTLYMQGVEALQNKDYKRAVTLLRPYRDLNSAVAFVCMDYNNSALEILEELPQSAACNYMKSVVYARMGRDKEAVEHFIYSVGEDPAMRHRGNLDPEISSLIKKYNVFEQLEK